MACRVLPRPMSSAIRTRPPRLIQYLARKFYWQINNGFLQPKLYYISLRLPERLSTRFWLVSYDKVSHWSQQLVLTPLHLSGTAWGWTSTLDPPFPSPHLHLSHHSLFPLLLLLSWIAVASPRTAVVRGTTQSLAWEQDWVGRTYTSSAPSQLERSLIKLLVTLAHSGLSKTFTTNLACYSPQHQSSMLKF